MVELPPSVVAAINRKVEQYYLVQEYAFRVDREKKESERKRIEAEGISAFQQIVSQGISDSYVRWRGIEATLQLAQSPNSKIVIIGSGKDGLPVILGNVDTPIAPKAAAAAPTDNSEAGKERPMGASPPLLEKLPASNLPTPSEQIPPTAVPRAPAGPPPAAEPGGPASTEGAGKQSATPPSDQRSSWTPTMAEIQALVSRVIGTGETPAEPPSASSVGPTSHPPPRGPVSVPEPPTRPAAGHPR